MEANYIVSVENENGNEDPEDAPEVVNVSPEIVMEVPEEEIEEDLDQGSRAVRDVVLSLIKSKLGMVKVIGSMMPLKRLRQNRWLVFVGLLCVMLGHHLGNPAFTEWAINEGMMSTRLALMFGVFAFIGGWIAFWMFIPDGSATFLDEISEDGDEEDA